jgi:hypothetical protein
MIEQVDDTVSLADLLTRIGSDSELSERRRRDLRSSLRTLARTVGRDPGAIEADFAVLQRLTRDIHSRQAGVSPKRWSNIRSDIAFAVRRYRLRQPLRIARHLTSAWRALRDRIQDDRIKHGLSRFIRYCDRRDLAPQEVTRATFDQYHRWLHEQTLVAKPDRLFKETCRLWNRAMRLVNGWPRLEAPVPVFTNRFGLPRETFPASFQDEVESWSRSLAGVDLLKTGPVKPLRPVSVRHSIDQVFRFASALAHQGHEQVRITGLSYLVEPEHFKAGLRFYLQRRGGEPSPGLSELASMLVHLARHWVGINEATHRILRDLAGRVQCRAPGLTERNRQRLRQFDDPRAQLAILDLPDRLVDLARRRPNDRKGTPRVTVGFSALGDLMASIDENTFQGFNDDIFVHHNSIATDTSLQSAATWQFNGTGGGGFFHSSAAMFKLVNADWQFVQTYARGNCAYPFKSAGDYSGAQLDPTLTGFWLAGERARDFDDSCQWGTRIAQLIPSQTLTASRQMGSGPGITPGRF